MDTLTADSLGVILGPPILEGEPPEGESFSTTYREEQGGEGEAVRSTPFPLWADSKRKTKYGELPLPLVIRAWRIKAE